MENLPEPLNPQPLPFENVMGRAPSRSRRHGSDGRPIMNGRPTGFTTECRTDEATNTPAPPLTVLEVLRLVWEAEHYPCVGNGDHDIAIELERRALEQAGQAVSEPNDPPGRRHCMMALLNGVGHGEKDEIMTCLDILFDREYRW